MASDATAVLFLDFDGVLNFTAMTPQAHACTCGDDAACTASGIAANLSRERVELVNAVIAETGADVVLSTSWRKAFDVAALSHALADAGLIGRVIGETISSARTFWRARGLEADLMQRGHEIAAWLLTHPSTERAVILDDDGDMWSLMPLLVQTDPIRGLATPDVDRAIKVTAASSSTLADLHATWPGGRSTP